MGLWNEFAIDPACFSSWNDYQLVFPHFGIYSGKLISKFPDDWTDKVHAEIVRNFRRNRIKEIEKKKLINKLEKIKNKLIAQSRKYSDEIKWVDNALEADLKEPFCLIISKINPTNSNRILKPEQIDEENELWNTPRQVIVERKFDIIAPLLKRLLLLSTEIILVDPHFHPVKSKYQKSLGALASIIFASGIQFTRVEYHLVGDPRENLTQFENSCMCYLPQQIPSGKQLKLIRWSSQQSNDPSAGGSRLHPRFILTDIGGINIEWGLDEGNSGDFTTITILEPGTHKKYWNLHQKETSTYTFQDEIIILGTK